MLKKILISACGLLVLGSLTGCATIVDGTKETVKVNTMATKGASCVLKNDKGQWQVKNTPASVVVRRSYKDLLITCKKAGYENAYQPTPSKTAPMLYGNILLPGGLIGAGIDAATGAAYDYPADIFVHMDKKAIA